MEPKQPPTPGSKLFLKYTHKYFITKRPLYVSADGVTYTFGLFLVELRTYFNEGAGATAWISSILAGVTLCSGEVQQSYKTCGVVEWERHSYSTIYKEPIY